MGASNRDLIFLVLDAFLALVYLVVLFLAMRRQKDWTSPAFWLAGYALLGLALHALLVAGMAGWLPWMDFVNRLRFDQSASIVLALFLFLGLRASLPRSPLKALFWGGLALSAAVLAVQNYTLIFLTWLLFSLVTGGYLLRALGQSRQHSQRSRIFFWLPALALAIANELVLFYQVGRIEIDYIRVLAVAMMAYTVLSHHLPDTRDFTRLVLIYILSTLLIVALYISGFWLADSLLRNTPGYQTIFAGAGVAAVISLLFAPIFGLIRGTVNRLFRLESYDPSQTLREYALSISNILELDKLSEVAIGLIKEALDIEKGVMYLVDQEIGEYGERIFRLREIGDKDSPAIDSSQDTKENPLLTPTGKLKRLNTTILADDSSIARFLREQHQPLLQYDLDFAPEFLDAPLDERKWFSKLGLDVYVPIVSKGDWIGLLALGPKLARRYTNEDLNLLAAIASQTGVALENARLFDNQKKLTSQLREAYAFLDKANHDLAKLEMTKSNFISIASHELRTPLTSIKGYTEMLLENPALGKDILPFVKGIHKGTVRLHEIMDSMFDVAQMDSRAIELQRQDVFVTELVRSVFQELSKFASEREQELSLDLPQLPSIKADPNTMRKLFHHLIINAIKFTPNKGKVTITGRHVPANNRDLPEGGVEIVVTDTGVGVDKNYQEVIFTKFYQPGELLNRHSTGKTKFKGSGVGLGLALSRGIVDAHGGKIWVVSPGYDDEKCPGSEFHIILPIRSQGESKTVRMGSAVKLKL